MDDKGIATAPLGLRNDDDSMMNLYYNDEHLAVVHKPYGVLSEIDDKKPNMPALLREALGCHAIFPVHRLDRTTQGLMLYAKTEEAARRLSEAIRRGEVEKNYRAVIEGEPPEKSGELSDLLFFDRRKNKSYVVKRERRGVKQACLHYETLQTIKQDGQSLSLVKIVLDTGRTHQIRVQFASRGTPLVGDCRYGSRVPCKNIMLCASELRFTHPFTGEKMHFTCSPTDDYFGRLSQQTET